MGRRRIIILIVLLFFLFGCKKEYTIKYDNDGNISSLVFIEGDEVKLETPLKEGYIFLGWFENDVLVEHIENRDYELKAKWKIIEYNINYDLNGGTCQDLVTTFSDPKLVTLPVPIKEGFKFLGWYEDNKQVTTLDKRDYNLIAEYKKEYVIAYNLDGGSCNELKETFLEDEEVILPTPIKEGYIFVGWYENKEKVEVITNRDYVLEAEWDELRVQLSFIYYDDFGRINTGGSTDSFFISDNAVYRQSSKDPFYLARDYKVYFPYNDLVDTDVTIEFGKEVEMSIDFPYFQTTAVVNFDFGDYFIFTERQPSDMFQKKNVFDLSYEQTLLKLKIRDFLEHYNYPQTYIDGDGNECTFYSTFEELINKEKYYGKEVIVHIPLPLIVKTQRDGVDYEYTIMLYLGLNVYVKDFDVTLNLDGGTGVSFPKGFNDNYYTYIDYFKPYKEGYEFLYWEDLATKEHIYSLSYKKKYFLKAIYKPIENEDSNG